MADVILVALIVAFIAICVAYVSWCDRIIGADDAVADTPTRPATDTTPIAAPEPETVTS